VRYYGTGGWGSDCKQQQCDFPSPVAGDLTGNCIIAILRHQTLGVCLEIAAVRCYGTGGWGSEWKLQHFDVTAPVAGGLIGNYSSAMLRHRCLGFRVETASVRCYGTGGWGLKTAVVRYYGTSGRGSHWKLQQCDVTVMAGGLSLNCSSAMLRHRWLGV